jgi:hypothetical protein
MVDGDVFDRACPLYCVTEYPQCPTFPHAVFWRTSILGRGRNSVLSTPSNPPPTPTCRYSTVFFSDCGPLEYITVSRMGLQCDRLREIRESGWAWSRCQRYHSNMQYNAKYGGKWEQCAAVAVSPCPR